MSYNEDNVGMKSKPSQVRKLKEPNVLKKIQKLVSLGRYRDTRHSLQRGWERNINLIDIIQVLETGFHEKSKDEYRVDFQSWNYAIRGTTVDGDHLRIAVYFEEDLVMIAAVIKL